MADAFEQELLTDISEAEGIGEIGLAAEWRLELKTYRAAKKQAMLEEQAWGGSSAVTRRERRSGGGGLTSRETTYLRRYAPCRQRLPVATELRAEVFTEVLIRPHQLDAGFVYMTNSARAEFVGPHVCRF